MGMDVMTDEEIEQMNRNNHKLILLIGGNPLGYREPFDERTKSGKVLRGLVAELGLSAKYFDLWKNPEQEADIYMDSDVLRRLIGFQRAGWTLVALGSKVQSALRQYNAWKEEDLLPKPLKFISLPHPAARRRVDLQKLKRGLKRIAYKS